MTTLFQDLRYGLRMLAKYPVFTAVAVATLALGIGANTAIFSTADAFLARPVALPHLNRLVAIVKGLKAPTSSADFLDWEKQSRSFQQMAAYRSAELNLTAGDQSERAEGAMVTANFFQTLEVEPALGRGFLPQEGETGHEHVAVLSEGVWKSRFGANPHIVGTSVRINGSPYTVVGVMGRNFDFPQAADLWLPLSLGAKERAQRGTRNLFAIASLKPGVGLQQANAEMATINHRLQEAYPADDKGWSVHVMPVRQFVQGSLTIAYTRMLVFAVALVLLLACANVANLQFARGSARGREIAVRAALGATRRRVIRQLLTESVLLAAAGGAGGLLLAYWLLQWQLAAMPREIAKLIPGWNEIGLNRPALAYAAAIALLSGIVSGLLPSFRSSKPNLNETLKEGRSFSTGRAQHRTRGVLVVAQIAIALVLLVGAGLMIKGFRQMVQQGARFQPQSLLTLSVGLTGTRYQEPHARLAFYQQALEHLRRLPGVQSAAVFTSFPLSNNSVRWSEFAVGGHVIPKPGEYPFAILQSISPEYFATMRIPLREGRVFGSQDAAASQPVAIVSEKLARLQWPGKDPLGKQIRVGGASPTGPWLMVVGVADDVLYDWTNNFPEPVIYQPMTQAPMAESEVGLRAAGDVNDLVQPTRRTLAGLDRDVPAFDVKSLGQQIYESTVGLAYVGAFMGILGFIALALSAAGIYSVMAYSVAERTHEIGIRMALGAARAEILKTVLKRGATLAILAFAIGVPSAIVLARLLAGLVYGTAPLDPITFIGVPAFLGAICLLACYIPARRATKVDPMVALRCE